MLSRSRCYPIRSRRSRRRPNLVIVHIWTTFFSPLFFSKKRIEQSLNYMQSRWKFKYLHVHWPLDGYRLKYVEKTLTLVIRSHDGVHLKAEQSDHLHTNYGNMLFIGTSYFGINRLNLPFLELFAATDPKWTPLYFFYRNSKKLLSSGVISLNINI